MLRLCGLQNNGDAEHGSDAIFRAGCDWWNALCSLAVVVTAVDVFELKTEGENGTGADGNRLFGIGRTLVGSISFNF